MNKNYLLLTAIFLIVLSSAAIAAPAINSFSIAGGNAYTNALKPAMNIDASDANGMAFSCDDATYTAFVAYAATYSDFDITNTIYGCTAGDGNKTVYLKVEATDGSTATSSDSIGLDQTAPSTTDNAPAGWQTAAVTVSLTPTDSGSGVNETKYKINAGSEQTGTSAGISSDGNNSLEYWSTDNAGNPETKKTVYILVDATGPAVNNKSPASGGYTNNVRQIIGFDLNDSLNDVNMASLVFKVNESTESDANIYLTHVSWQPSSNFGEGAVNVEASVKDNLGNNKTEAWSFTVDTVAPSISSFSIGSSEYTSSGSPVLNISASGAAYMYFSCDGSSWSGAAAYAGTYSGFSIESGNGCSSGDGTKTVYARVSDDAGNYSSNSSDTIRLDKTAPSTPSNFSASANSDGTISLSWSASSDSSGINSYYLYESTSSGFSPGTEFTTLAGTSYTRSGLSSGTAYYYKVKAKDLAGNFSSESSQASDTTVSETSTSGQELNVKLTAPDYAGAETFRISITSNESFEEGMLSVKLPGKTSWADLRSNQNNTGFSVDYKVPSGTQDGSLVVRFSYYDPNAAETKIINKWITIDAGEPEIEWLAPNESQEVSGRMEISVRATDAGGSVTQVSFYAGANLLSRVKKGTTDDFIFSWDTTKESDGAVTLKAVAADSAGNTSEKTINAVVQNLAEEQPVVGETVPLTEEETIPLSEENAEPLTAAAPAFGLFALQLPLQLPVPKNVFISIALLVVAAVIAGILLQAGSSRGGLRRQSGLMDLVLAVREISPEKKEGLAAVKVRKSASQSVSNLAKKISRKKQAPKKWPPKKETSLEEQRKNVWEQY